MDIIISNSSQQPIYEQILRQIQRMIITGKLKEGQALPSIRNLARDLQVSVITTKRAYEELEREGMIETVAGKGSFVAGHDWRFLREKQLRMVEEKLAVLVQEAGSLGIQQDELKKMLADLFKED